jgi:hypothetical protein
MPFASPINVLDASNCHFYHSMDLPGLGSVLGEWDLRGEFAHYTDGCDFIVGSIFEHLADPINALASISRVTSETMVIVTPMLDTDDPRAQFLGHCERPENDYNVWMYSRVIYHHILAMLGFRIERPTRREFVAGWDGKKRHERYVITAKQLAPTP